MYIVPQQRLEPKYQLRRPINAYINKQPLSTALVEISETTGFTIVLDGRVGEEGKKEITASFERVPLETAVKVLADMADLKPVTVDNVIYVTTKENAKDWMTEKELEKPTQSKANKKD